MKESVKFDFFLFIVEIEFIALSFVIIIHNNKEQGTKVSS